MQLKHHLTNWTSLPGKLMKRLEAFIADVKPPMPDDELRKALSTATEEYGQRISGIVRDHLNRKLNMLETEAGNLNPLDLDRTRTTAEKYVNKRLGKKMDDVSRQTLLHEAASKIGKTARIDADGFVQVQRSPGKTARVNVNSNVSADEPMTPLAPQMRGRSASGGSPAQSNSPLVLSPVNRFAQLMAETETNGETTSQPGKRQAKIVLDRVQAPEPTFKSKAGVIVHNKDKKDQWKINVAPKTDVLVIGDSNLRDAPHVPCDWKIHSFPGSRMSHVTKLVETLQVDAHLSTVICQVGINHRDDQPSRIDSDLKETVAKLQSTGLKVIMAGVPMPESLDTRREQAINGLNARLADGPFRYIDPVPRHLVVLRPDDWRFAIHHTEDTVELVVDSMEQEVVRGESLN